MNPSYEQPGLSLPEPLGNGGGGQAVSEKTSSTSPEFAPPTSQQVPAVSSSTPASLAIPPVNLVPLASTQAAATTAAANPSLADDADLIEKEWVTRARAIVQRTKEDPREQSHEMNRFKADYLKKRYNKDIKISEG